MRILTGTTTGIFFLVMLLAGLTSGADAAVITFQASNEFSGGTSPAGAAPWVTATFQDTVPGVVTMTLTATNLTGSEFISNYYFNIDSSMNPSNLTFSAPVKTGSFTSPSINLGTDSYKADGGGYFDINLSFATSSGANSRFTAGDSVSYTISGVSGLSASSFNFLSSPSGGNGVHPDASHVQGIGTDGSYSGWVSTPEPATMGLLVLGGLAMLARRKRQP